MARLLATSTLALTLIALGCSSGAKPGARGGDTGGEGGDGGSGDTGGSTGTGGSKPTGLGGSGATGGSGPATGGASGDTGGAGGMSMMDASMTPIDTGPDGTSVSGDGGVMLGGEVQTTKPWIHLCPKSWTQTQCCELLCQCLDVYCQSSPLDKPRIAGCMPMCMKLTDYRARCQVYHCFESQSPTAVKDHDSHCGHASGRVGGGGCTIIDAQK
jgi:hypothetical protein